MALLLHHSTYFTNLNVNVNVNVTQYYVTHLLSIKGLVDFDQLLGLMGCWRFIVGTPKNLYSQFGS